MVDILLDSFWKYAVPFIDVIAHGPLPSQGIHSEPPQRLFIGNQVVSLEFNV